MSSEWPLATLAQLCLLVVDCPHSTPVWTPTGKVVLRNQNIKDGRLDLSSPSFTDEAHFAARIRRAKPTAGDIVITREAPMGEVCMVPVGLECCLGQRQVLLRPDPSKVNGQFLLYALQSPSVQHQIGWNEGTGSTVSNLRIPVLESLKVTVPPLDVQQNLASILAAIDDRITLLRDTNATLEAIAEALFKSWFVDFDPVRANGDGRAPEGMDEATAALFPDSLEDSELGQVPRGWQVKSFADTVQILGGGTPKTSIEAYWGGPIPWFSVVDAPTLSDVYVLRTEKSITEAGLRNSSTKLLPEGTTIISARGTVGRLALTACAMAMNQSCYGLRGTAGDVFFTYYSTKSLVEALQQRAHGSVFDTITRDTLNGVEVVQPDESMITAFDATVAPLMARIRVNIAQAHSLAGMRDTLLPRLISGQLRLPEAAETVAEALA